MQSTTYCFYCYQYSNPSYCVSFILYFCISFITNFSPKWHYKHYWGFGEVDEHSKGAKYLFICDRHILIPMKQLYRYFLEKRNKQCVIPDYNKILFLTPTVFLNFIFLFHHCGSYRCWILLPRLDFKTLN